MIPNLIVPDPIHLNKKSWVLLVALIAILAVTLLGLHSKDLLVSRRAENRQVTLDTANWLDYRNNTLGVEFKHPKDINGEEVVVFQSGNILFVTTASSTIFKNRDELALGTDQEILEKARELEGGDLPTWAILLRDAHSDQDLNEIIQEKFGSVYPSGCKLGDKSMSTQENVLNVNIDPVRQGRDDKYDSDSSCWINWRVAFKYSRQYNRAAIWDIGQEGKFLLTCRAKQDCEADMLMGQSFKFIETK